MILKLMVMFLMIVMVLMVTDRQTTILDPVICPNLEVARFTSTL